MPPISPDQSGKGVPSDHSGVIATPHTNSTLPPQNNKVRKNVRPIPESVLFEFGKKLATTDFRLVYSQPSSTQIVAKLQDLLTNLVEETFPLKSIVISSEDLPFFNENLRALKRRRLREYCNHGKSDKYNELQRKFDDKFENTRQK